MTWNTTNNTVSTSSGDVGVTIAKLKEQIAELKMSLEANMAPIPITVDVAPPNKWGGPSAKWGAYFKSTSYATSHATSSVADFKDKSKIPPLLYHPSQEEE